MTRTAILGLIAVLGSTPRGEGTGTGTAAGTGTGTEGTTGTGGTGTGTGASTGTGTGTEGAAGTGTATPPLTFEAWHQALPDDQKALIDGHVSGLKTTMTTEREARKTLEGQIKDLLPKAEKGSELETKLTAISEQLTGESQRADFFEKAHSAGVLDLKLAWIVAREGKLFKHNGDPDFEAIKAAHPTLFKSATAPPANAGSGTGSGGGGAKPPNADVNSAIREAAGYRG